MKTKLDEIPLVSRSMPFGPVAAMILMLLLAASGLPIQAAGFKEKLEKFRLKPKGSVEVCTIKFRGDDVWIKLPGGGSPEYREAVATFKNGGDAAAAEKMLRAVTTEQPAFAPAWLALGVILEARGELKEALAAYIKADANGDKLAKEEALAGIARCKARARFAGSTL